jgi:hypothetical protein
MRFLIGTKGLSIVEYILGGALTLAIAGLAVYGVITATSDQGAATETSIDSMPAQPTW